MATKYGSFTPAGEPETRTPEWDANGTYPFYTYRCSDCSYQAEWKDTRKWAMLAIRKHMATAHGKRS